jgi:hypothetical protein
VTTRLEPISGVVESLNVGTPRLVPTNGHNVLTAIWKHPVQGPVALRGVNLLSDDQADRSVHGGPDKAVYAYAHADIDWWETELGRSLGEAPFGENLTASSACGSGTRGFSSISLPPVVPARTSVFSAKATSPRAIPSRSQAVPLMG